MKKHKPINLLRAVADATEQKPKYVKQIYEALVEVVHSALKQDRRCRLPELGILRIKSRKATKKRKGISPFTKQPMVFKAKPASNKVRFTPAKDLRAYADKLPVEGK